MKALIRPRLVYELVGLSQMQVWRLRRAGRFPEPVTLGANSKAFVRDEIDAWIEARIAEREAALGNKPRTAINGDGAAPDAPAATGDRG